MNENLNDAQKLERTQKMLLGKITEIGLGQFVGLYQGIVSGNGTSMDIKWAEKTLDKSNALKEIPCAN